MNESVSHVFIASSTTRGKKFLALQLNTFKHVGRIDSFVSHISQERFFHFPKLILYYFTDVIIS